MERYRSANSIPLRKNVTRITQKLAQALDTAARSAQNSPLHRFTASPLHRFTAKGELYPRTVTGIRVGYQIFSHNTHRTGAPSSCVFLFSHPKGGCYENKQQKGACL